ncbi:MAG: hypothetical protein PHY48_14450 [Candidatus Cloacimonetes bacterium]|nr:hypothetical protein [Candidatus Cloacimonadota bacterium]
MIKYVDTFIQIFHAILTLVVFIALAILGIASVLLVFKETTDVSNWIVGIMAAMVYASLVLTTIVHCVEADYLWVRMIRRCMAK